MVEFPDLISFFFVSYHVYYFLSMFFPLLISLISWPQCVISQLCLLYWNWFTPFTVLHLISVHGVVCLYPDLSYLIGFGICLPLCSLSFVFFKCHLASQHCWCVSPLVYLSSFLFLLLFFPRSLLTLFSSHSTLPALVSSPLYHVPCCSEQLTPST